MMPKNPRLTGSGRIESVEVKQGVYAKDDQYGHKANTPWKKLNFTISGKKYGTFDTSMEKFTAGHDVDFVYEDYKHFHNLVSMSPAGMSSGTSFSHPVGATVQQIPIKTAGEVYMEENREREDKRQKAIVRQNCNERAIELFEILTRINDMKKIDSEMALKIIDDFAEHFENRVWR